MNPISAIGNFIEYCFPSCKVPEPDIEIDIIEPPTRPNTPAHDGWQNKHFGD